MKAIITGGRNVHMSRDQLETLNEVHARWEFSEVVVGDASGIDREGALWARAQRIPVKIFAADWRAYGRAAGPKRNKAMLDYAGTDAICFVFFGGRGTANMRRQAERAGLPIIDISE